MSASNPPPYVEHVNATVQDVDRAVRFLTTALPGWGERGSGTMDWFGQPMHWVHIGDDGHYIALQSGGVGAGVDWRSNGSGIKHVGIVVPSVQAVVDRLQAAGFAKNKTTLNVCSMFHFVFTFHGVISVINVVHF